MRFTKILFLQLIIFNSFSQFSDSSIVLKSHINQVLQRAKEENKMILLMPYKTKILQYNSLHEYEVETNIGLNGSVKVKNLRQIKLLNGVDAWLNTLKKIFPLNYVIAPIDLTYGEGELFNSKLSIFIPAELMTERVLLLNSYGNVLGYTNRLSLNDLEFAYANTKIGDNPVFDLKYFWQNLLDYNLVISKKTQAKKNYQQDKFNALYIKELYQVNKYLGIEDCEVSDAYFEVRKTENKEKFFEDEAELIKFSCKENSKARQFFLENPDKSSLHNFWLEQLYNQAVNTKNKSLFDSYLKFYTQRNSCKCEQTDENFIKAKFANEIKDLPMLKAHAEKFLIADYFNLESEFWKKENKKTAKSTITHLTDEILGFYLRHFYQEEELITALFWADKAIEIDEENYLIQTKAKILSRLQRKDEAIKLVKDYQKRSKWKTVSNSKNVDFDLFLKELENGVY